ncbi:hypothetical protein ACJU26_05565 [Acidithiobacillus sp. M4-SHS-6]|uniref:hypothetical protein n=1 Tax=Acidithiobacillus sp. M4-SHS-6 TaxID=3383024 RepID=UPI0039BEB8B7
MERQFGANVRGLLRILDDIACGRRDPTRLLKEKDIAINLKARYEKAVSNGTLEVVKDEDE